MIIGNVADDDVFKTVDMYFKGIWEEDRAMQELKYYKKNDQICVVNQDVINTYLKFVKSYEVRN
ncbi:MAG: DUF3990 domain-containing protein [Lachnospiraceae bacterium]|nr:DUF3990 domain-containing protein [Lachnospiraceae bacterium]